MNIDFSKVVTADDKEQAAYEEARSLAKAQRAINVKKITVTVSNMVFDGDETSQNRMARAICALADGESTYWTLNDNTIANVTKVQLKEALRLAGEKQTQMWSLEV